MEYLENMYINSLTDEDISQILNLAFNDVAFFFANKVYAHDMLISVKRKSHQLLQRYYFSDFNVQAENVQTKAANKLKKAYINFMLTAKNSKGELRFVNYQQHLALSKSENVQI